MAMASRSMTRRTGRRDKKVIIIERKLFGVFPYTTVFFPDTGAVEELMESVAPGHLARFFWTAAELDLRGRIIRRQQTATVCLDLRNSIEVLWQAVAKNGRNEIRSAERLGDRIRIERNGAQTGPDFLSLYDSFSRIKDGVATINAEVLQRYAEHAEIFVAYLDDRPMCGHVYLRDAVLARTRLFYSASRRLEDRASSRLCGQLNRLLHWREITAFREDGLITYDFGGIRTDRNDGIAKFKSSFGGAVSREFNYLCVGSPLIGVVARVFHVNVWRRRSSSMAGSDNPPPEIPSEVRDSA
jgi:hypothetical protein